MSEITMFSRDEGHRLLIEARRLRSEQLVAGALWVGRTAINLARAVGTAFAEARCRRETYESLSRLTDRQLRDIGLTRPDISAVAASVRPREAPTHANPVAAVATAGEAARTPAASSTRKSASGQRHDNRSEQRIAA